MQKELTTCHRISKGKGRVATVGYVHRWSPTAQSATARRHSSAIDHHITTLNALFFGLGPSRINLTPPFRTRGRPAR